MPDESEKPDLSARIAAAKSNRSKGKKAIDDLKQRESQGLGLAMKMSAEFVAAIIIGGVFGFWLDKVTGLAPLFLIVMFSFGFVTGTYNLLRSVSAMQED